MGKSSSKFDPDLTITDFGAAFLGKQGLEVIFGDDEFRRAIEDAAATFWESYQRKDVTPTRTQLVGKIGKVEFDVRMMIQQGIVKELITQAARRGWALKVFCNLQNDALYGHSWLFKKEEVKQSFKQSVSINPADRSEVYISGSSRKFVEDVEDIIRGMSTEKGIKQVDNFDDHNGKKVILRHKPWDVDEFDWCGGSYLLAKMIEKLASYDMPIYVQGTPAVGLSADAYVCVVTPVDGSKFRFRRAPKKAVRSFEQKVEELWPDCIDKDTEQDKMGYILQFKKDLMDEPKLIHALFESMHEHGFRYITGMRVSSHGKGRSAMCFANGGDVPKGALASIFLKGPETMVLTNISESAAQELATAVGAAWEGGIKKSNNEKIILKGGPFSQDVHPDMIMCNVLKTLDAYDYAVLAAVTTGAGGDMFIFESA